jgi:hypothetical protein
MSNGKGNFASNSWNFASFRVDLQRNPLINTIMAKQILIRFVNDYTSQVLDLFPTARCY